MSGINLDYNIINQKGTPAFYSDIFANRPSFGYAGRVFISTDTGAIYEDTGSAWTLIADAGAGTTGTLQQVTTNGNTTTLGIVVQGININDGAGTGVNNIAIGSTALSINTTGQYNTAIGSNNLEKNTTGQGNTAIGYNTLINNISGINNTAVGVSALTGNTTGSYNIAVGNGSLGSNTTAEYNTAIGFTSLTLNTTGQNNTGVGANSLGYNTTGSFNTSNGANSLLGNTTGSGNTGIGYNSLFANTTGGSNTAIGGSALSSNTTASFNTAIGNAALQSNTTGSQNTAIGYFTLSANTTGDGNVAVGYLSSTTNTTGVNNSSLGISSLRLNTTGSNNTAIGSVALQNNTTADNNTAIGYASLSANTTGANNTAIGIQSLLSNTTGTQNTAIGVSALSSNTTGSSNTAIGYNSLNKNTTSGQNTAIGYLTLGENTSGTQNTSIGYGALALNTTGFSNTAIGSNSLAVNTTGNNNTAIGIDSLNVNTGSNNTAIGRASLTANTTGTLNTAIGYNSGNAITTGSNNTILGNYVGTPTLASNIVLSDGAGNVRLFSNATGLIGINQAVGTPSAQLDIHTTATYGLAVNGTGTSNAYLGFANASTYKWRIGNNYSAGTNSFDITNVGLVSTALSFNSTNNNATFYSSVYINATSLGLDLTANGAYIYLAGRYTRNGGNLLANNGSGTNLIFAETSVNTYTFGAGNPNNAPTNSVLALNTSTGNCLIGTTTDDTSNKLQVNGSVKITGNSFLTGYIRSNTGYETRIDGSAGITPTFYLSNVANGRVWNIQLGASNELTTWYFDGSSWSAKGYQTTSGVWTNSDIRKKKDIEELNYGLDEVLKLKPKKYKYIHDIDNKLNGKKDMGFIAQEVINIIPEAVGSYIENDTEFLSMSYANLVPILVKAIQELNGKLLRNNIN